MSSKMNRHAYQQLIDEDIAWLEKQPRTLERDHIALIVRQSVDAEYPDRIHELYRAEKLGRMAAWHGIHVTGMAITDRPCTGSEDHPFGDDADLADAWKDGYREVASRLDADGAEAPCVHARTWPVRWWRGDRPCDDGAVCRDCHLECVNGEWISYEDTMRQLDHHEPLAPHPLALAWRHRPTQDPAAGCPPCTGACMWMQGKERCPHYPAAAEAREAELRKSR